MSKIKVLATVDAVKEVEVVSGAVSEKYVPIYTSEIIEALAPEFKFVSGIRISQKTSLHYVDLSNGEDTLRIYNSFDRSFALRMSYITADIPVDLGVNRLVHIGTKAKTFLAEIKENKTQILEALETAKEINTYLGANNITKKIAKGISDVIFAQEMKQKEFQDYTNYIDMLVPKGITIKAYIKQSITKYNEGDYTYTVNGIKKTGLRKSSLFRKIVLEREIMDFIADEFVELML